ncbi:Hypothetical protein, putative [Bodo saltans]|uniref:Glycosyltransferase 61 catalytic domain-containing protein n=1 Tax=Bodo saltans TaxID=75058 RepID=A0A0S4JKB9_BODSA|nr:Hypothetical protein, putative [Bodo saltans]|eukprot:CUG90834.1 Hypothetical protein, putative [Bodo saltans]
MHMNATSYVHHHAVATGNRNSSTTTEVLSENSRAAASSSAPLDVPVASSISPPHPTHVSVTAPTQSTTPATKTSKSPTTSSPPESLKQFVADCSRTDTGVLPKWSTNAVLHDVYLTRGQQLFCTQGKQLFWDAPGEGNWALARGDAKMYPIQDAAWYHNESTHLVLHPRVAVVTTTLLSMYHMLNDFVLPWPLVLEQIIKRKSPKFPSPPGDTSWLNKLPLDYILLHVDGSLRGTGNDDVALMVLSTLLPNDGELRKLIYDNTARDASVHCYCRAMLQMPTFLITYPKLATTMIVDGDFERRRWTEHMKSAINRKFGFLPYGTYPIPDSAVKSLWTAKDLPPLPTMPAATNNTSDQLPLTMKPSTTTIRPRLVVYLRTTTRLIWRVDEMIAMAKAVGFDVLVLFPERYNLTVQATSARYADVVMAIHGAALTWIALLDTRGRFSHCREVIELCHYGRPFKRVHNVYEVLAADNQLWYTRLAPTGVLFDANVIPGKYQRQEKKLLNKKSFPHELLGFRYQTAVYDMPTIARALQSSFDRVSSCLRDQKPISRSLLPKDGQPVWKLS